MSLKVIKAGRMKFCKCGRFISVNKQGAFKPHKIFAKNKWCVSPKSKEHLPD